MSAVAADPSRLEMRGIGKSFGSVSVLQGVDLELGVGEVLALLGQNGAGKSTLVKILGGDYARDAGTIMLDGAEVHFSSPRSAIGQGVRILPQELSVMPEMTVAENILIGDLPASLNLGISRLDRTAMDKKALDLLAELGLEVNPRALLKSLAVSEQRIVEIARAISGQAKVLVMDEPTAALTEPEVNRLFEIIRRLKTRGVSIIYISHRMDEVFEISDRVLVLRDGRVAGRFETARASREEVFAAMLGDAVEGLYPEGQGQIGNRMLEVSHYNLEKKLVDISLDVRQGEIVGVFGLIGSGIEVLGKALFGALGNRPKGNVTLEGKAFQPRNPEDAIRHGLGYIAAERKREGILAELSVRENITLPFLERFQRGLGISVSNEEKYAHHWIEQLSIRTRSSSQKLRYLSGGNQQKVVLARWLADGVKLLIMEEPTRGVDVGARKEIYAALRDLSNGGLAILMISSDVEEVANLSDRVVVLDRGRVAARFERGISTKELMHAAAQTIPSH